MPGHARCQARRMAAACQEPLLARLDAAHRVVRRSSSLHLCQWRLCLPPVLECNITWVIAVFHAIEDLAAAVVALGADW